MYEDSGWKNYIFFFYGDMIKQRSKIFDNPY